MVEATSERKEQTLRALRWCAVAIALVLLVIAAYGIVEMLRGPKIFEHVAASHTPFELPADATDVCGVTRPAFYPSLFYEFSTSEQSFVKWAGAKGFSVSEIEPAGFRIFRYTFVSQPDLREHEVIVKDGLFFEQWLDVDTGYRAAYDRNLKRAYYHMQNR